MKSLFKWLPFLFLLTNVLTQARAQNYKSENLEVKKLAENVYQHISYLKTEDFGKVSCNGMIVVDDGQALVFDTPAEASATEDLINWIKTALNGQVKAVIATHFHADCLGGLDVFHAQDIPSYAQQLTLTLAAQKKFSIPMHGFKKSQHFTAGNTRVEVAYFGAGHTLDNIVAYVPSANIMFGGCLIKELGAGKGNLEDADTAAWPLTVQQVKNNYPKAKLIIPGHGKVGDLRLLDYTKNLFQQ
jgi:metallo-beta-lactamase class B